MEDSTSVLTFRQIISLLKKRILDETTLDSQNRKDIYKAEKIMKEMFHAIRKVLERKAEISSLEQYNLDILLEDLFKKGLSDDERETIVYYLRRDLLTFPFTIDTFHINSNLVENDTEE
jgi:hypothetical protein